VRRARLACPRDRYAPEISYVSTRVSFARRPRATDENNGPPAHPRVLFSKNRNRDHRPKRAARDHHRPGACNVSVHAFDGRYLNPNGVMFMNNMRACMFADQFPRSNKTDLFPQRRGILENHDVAIVDNFLRSHTCWKKKKKTNDRRNIPFLHVKEYF